MAIFLEQGAFMTKQYRLKFDTDGLSLKDALRKFGGNKPSEIPFVVRLIENPQSPMALPGKIDLYNHDCLHIILGLGTSIEAEAFIIGFTMGNDIKTNWLHLQVFKLISGWFYPKIYKFHQSHMKEFDLGVDLGRKFKYKNLNAINFHVYEDKLVGEIRHILKINLEEISAILIEKGQVTNLPWKNQSVLAANSD